MNIPGIDDQQFTDTNLRGFLLKGINPNEKHPTIKQINEYLIRRVDDFWEAVVVPMREKGTFDGNKINWYFEVYKEGIQAHKSVTNQFSFINIEKEAIEGLVKFFEGKNLIEYIELGTSFLANAHMTLSAWMRDQLIAERMRVIYSSENPLDWIETAEKEERGLMLKGSDVPGLEDVMKNIGLLMSKRV